MWSNHKALSLHHSTGKEQIQEEGDKRRKEEQKKRKKVEHDFVLKLSLFFRVSEMSEICAVVLILFCMLIAVYVTFVSILFYLRNSVFFFCTRFCVSLFLDYADKL